jgi:hypothetical protein
VEAVTHTLAKYVMELSLCDYSLVAEPPSRLAAAALALSIRLLEPGLSAGNQCCGSGSVSRLDTDSIGSLDPYPDSQSGSVSRSAKMSHKHRKN